MGGGYAFNFGSPLASLTSSLAISWVLSTISGYGIYGIEIALQFFRRGGGNLILPKKPALYSLPPLSKSKLIASFDLASKLEDFLIENPKEFLNFSHAVLHACGNDFLGFEGQDKIWGKPNVGCAAIEHLMCSEIGKSVSKSYDMFIAISKWNADFLKSLNVGPVHLCHQGVNGSLFFPGPRSNLYRNRFVIFSGGKFEFRKGQDLVLTAFKRFHARHPEALLVTCWQNLLMPNAAAFEQVGYCKTVPKPAPEHGLMITPWLLEQGLAPDSFIDLPFTHNLFMPSILRECDVALFPNRCEGGTNLVAMEAMACGVPTYVAYNTGQKDLVDLIGVSAFKTQRALKPAPAMATLADWGETDPDEIVEALEFAFTHQNDVKQKAMVVAEKMKEWEWGVLNEKLLQIACDQKMEAA